ncbi:MAG TPA: hypothetical protein VMB80_09590 [Candidatus Acidoferrum sp.]|nr:hypothetical protein [Candidatus Acidoferrum sp.]
MNGRHPRRKLWWLLALPAGIALLAVPAGSIFYAAAGDKACIRCHEIQPAYDQWMISTHRSVQCKECHGSLFSTDAGFHLNNARQLWRHLRGQVPEQLQLRQRDISRGLNERCGQCHQAEYAAWAAGPHHVSYGKIFLDPGHNQGRLLTDYCLHCHGMYFERGIRDLVQPIDLKGPWQWAAATVRPQEPAIPCSACHAMHRPGTPLGLLPAGARTNDPSTHQPSLAFYDRREQLPFGIAILPLPEIRDGSRPVKISPDVKQANCYQCHAPDHTFQAGSGDDRTCVGVHEGLSCLACHAGHDQDPRASCAQCHPRLSNCGLDVETMDTTFKSSASLHNVHFVKCADCHPHGVPERPRRPDAPPGAAP